MFVTANIFLPLPPTFYTHSLNAGCSTGTKKPRHLALQAGIDKRTSCHEASGRRETRYTGFVFEYKGVQQQRALRGQL